MYGVEGLKAAAIRMENCVRCKHGCMCWAQDGRGVVFVNTRLPLPNNSAKCGESNTVEACCCVVEYLKQGRNS